MATYEKSMYMLLDTTGLYLNTVADMILADNGSPTFIDFMVNKVKVSQYAVNPDDFEPLRDYLNTNSFLETALKSQSPLSILDLDWSLRSQVINGMTNQELHDLMVMEYGSTVNFANSVLLNDPCYDVMSLSILSSSYYNFAAALLNQANPVELQALWDFYFFPTALPGNMLQVADDLFNTLDPDIYNKILALDGVKDNFFMAYELHFGFGSLETYLVGYSDFKLCTRNAITDAGLIGIYNMHDQNGLWGAMNLLYTWELLADKMIQYNPDAFLLAGLPYFPTYATTMLQNGDFVYIGPYQQPLYQISLEQFFDSIRTYPGLGEAYMLQLTNQLIALGYASPGWSYAVGEHHIYGSSRLGIHQTKKELRNRYKQEEIFIPSNTVNTTALYRGKRNYELSNHLGNVQVVITDKRKSVCDEELEVEYFKAEVLQAVDFYPFGKILPDRQWYHNNDTSQLINGFNGMRYDHDINQKGRNVDYGGRILDVDLGRWMSCDALEMVRPGWSSYKSFNNNPLSFIDKDGRIEYHIHVTINENTGEALITMSTSNNLMTDGSITFVRSSFSSDSYKATAYYDYARVTITTISNGESTTQTFDPVLLKEFGVQETKAFFFWPDKKGSTIKEEFNERDHGQEVSFGIGLVGGNGNNPIAQDYTKNIIGTISINTLNSILKQPAITKGWSPSKRSWEVLKEGKAKDILDKFKDAKGIGEKAGETVDKAIDLNRRNSKDDSIKVTRYNLEGKVDTIYNRPDTTSDK